MLRFFSQRLIYIISICILIIFSIYLGMGMVNNSVAQNPSFNLVRNGQRAWNNTLVYIEDLFTGDLGQIRHERFGQIAIWDLLKDTYLNSMGLLATALFVSTVLGFLFGVFAALIKNKMILMALMLLTILGVSTPSFFAGLLLQQGELLYLDTFGRALVKMAGFGWDFKHMFLPVLVLMARPLAYLTRASFISLNNVLGENYIQTARAKGLYERTIINVHAFRNIAIPVLTAIGISIRFSLSTLPVVEFFFAWPGIGLRLLEAIQQGQNRLVVTFALVLGLTIQLINLALEMAYRLIDPRLREES
jgi:peptide/nickel transport system permease protein